MVYFEFIRRTFIAVVITITVILSVIILWNLRQFVLIGMMGWVISIAFNIPITWLRRHRVSRSIAIALTLVGTLIVLVLFLTIVLPPLVSQMTTLVEELPNAAEDVVRLYEDWYDENPRVHNILPVITQEDFDEVLNRVPDDQPDFIQRESEPSSQVDLGTFINSAVPILGGISAFVAEAVASILLVFVVAVYFVADPFPYYRGILAMVPKNAEERAVEIMNEVRQIVIAWLGALVVSIVFQAVLTGALLTFVLDLPVVMALGLIAGVSKIIPSIGYYIAFIPIVIFAAADDPVKIIPAMAMYWLANEIVGKIITPSLIQRELSLPPGLTLLFQLIAAFYLGVYGILLAVPILGVIMLLVRELYVVGILDKRESDRILVEDKEGQLQLREPSRPLHRDIELKKDAPTPPTGLGEVPSAPRS